MYDQYGKEGLNPSGKRRRDDDFDFHFDAFVFRDPEDVFREFFGDSSPLSEFFGLFQFVFYVLYTAALKFPLKFTDTLKSIYGDSFWVTCFESQEYYTSFSPYSL